MHIVTGSRPPAGGLQGNIKELGYYSMTTLLHCHRYVIFIVVMKTIVVAGGTDGLGLEIVKLFAENTSQKIVVLGRNNKNLSPLSHRVSFFPIDITKTKEIELFAKQFQDQIHVLIISVGIFGHGTLTNFSYDQIRQSIETNLLGHIFLTRALLPKMSAQSRIVSINSISGILATKERSLLCAAKWGLRGFYCSLTEELKEKKIMVTQVFPGYFDSDYMNKVGIPKDKSKAINKTLIAKYVVALCELPESTYIPEIQIKNIEYS